MNLYTLFTKNRKIGRIYLKMSPFEKNVYSEYIAHEQLLSGESFRDFISQSEFLLIELHNEELYENILLLNDVIEKVKCILEE